MEGVTALHPWIIFHPGSPSAPNGLPIGRIGNPCDPSIIPKPHSLFGLGLLGTYILIYIHHDTSTPPCHKKMIQFPHGSW